jgi:hypothetical protein
MAKIVDVKVVNLMINPDNPRFTSVSNQREAIKVMLENQSEKIHKLAEDILEAGLNPSDLPMILPIDGDSGRYLVLEGNRRMVALKILHEPELIPNDMKSFMAKIKKLSDAHIIPEYVTCAVFVTPEEAYDWIRLKHTGENQGIGTVTWDGIQAERFREYMGKPSIALQTIEYVKAKGNLSNEQMSKVDDLAITNVARLINDPDVKDFLGISFENGSIQSYLPEEEVVKGLKKIVLDVAEERINVNDIRGKDDRANYISNFTSEETPDKTKAGITLKVLDFTKATSSPPIKLPRSKLNPATRKKLIPGSFSVKINETRINTIYWELKRLDLTYSNAVAVLLRVFLELSLDPFIEKIPCGPVDINSSLPKKLNAVMTYFKDNKIMTDQELKPVRISLSSADRLLSIDTLHAYVHNYHINPKAEDLKATWDNLEKFVSQIWTQINSIV